MEDGQNSKLEMETILLQKSSLIDNNDAQKQWKLFGKSAIIVHFYYYPCFFRIDELLEIYIENYENSLNIRKILIGIKWIRIGVCDRN